jgi:hypothetical protein
MRMHLPPHFGNDTRWNLPSLSLVAFLVLSLFSMVASLDPAPREELTSKLVASLQVSSQSSSDEDDELPVLVLQAPAPKQPLITHKTFAVQRTALAVTGFFHRHFDPRGPPSA